ncbi:MAG: DUF935 family protein [Chthoniobacter sp.]
MDHRLSPAPPALATLIRPQARERWLLPQVAAITPTYIEMTLRGALAGAHIPQWELFNLMEDTWPRLRKNVLELKMAVRSRRAVFEAYRDEDEEESPTATERMKLVSAALRQMQPDPTVDEGAFDDLITDILDAWFKGVSVLEIDWHVAQTRALGRFVAPARRPLGQPGKLRLGRKSAAGALADRRWEIGDRWRICELRTPIFDLRRPSRLPTRPLPHRPVQDQERLRARRRALAPAGLVVVRGQFLRRLAAQIRRTLRRSEAEDGDTPLAGWKHVSASPISICRA